MVDDYTRVERLLVEHGPPRSAGTTLAMAIEKLVHEVRQEERRRESPCPPGQGAQTKCPHCGGAL